jgi:serine-type D-Ala-D-Ala carboxypeptidase/endopeptidase (penicillin-binding protein 4)
MLPAKTIRRWLPLALLSLLAILAWVAAGRADIDEASTEPIVYAEMLGSPVLSARRIPQTLQEPIAREALAPTIDTVLTNSTPDTCLIVSIDGRIIGQQNPTQPLVPASNQKLVTTFTALQTFGADATFRTLVRADATPTAGVLDGNLYLVGGGDPFLGTDNWWSQYDDLNGRAHTRLEDLADSVVAAGITQVTGSVIGDESYFDSERTGIWAQRLIDSNQSGPLSALAVNEGYPPLLAAQLFNDLLTERGITVDTESQVGKAPSTALEIAAISSPPLAELITHVNSYSHNFGAEILVKHLGLNASGSGSTPSGTAAINAHLRQNDFPMSGVTIVDGSGLAETNTLTCSLLAALLDSAGPDSIFAQSLSIAGERGSLIRRHVETAAQARLLAKTGTLNDVTALSGFVLSSIDEGTALVFAYIVNGELAGQDETIRGLQSPFVEDLVLYPQAPAIDALAPLPTTPIEALPADESTG